MVHEACKSKWPRCKLSYATSRPERIKRNVWLPDPNSRCRWNCSDYRTWIIYLPLIRSLNYTNATLASFVFLRRSLKYQEPWHYGALFVLSFRLGRLQDFSRYSLRQYANSDTRKGHNGRALLDQVVRVVIGMLPRQKYDTPRSIETLFKENSSMYKRLMRHQIKS